MRMKPPFATAPMNVNSALKFMATKGIYFYYSNLSLWWNSSYVAVI